jgi:hypothetical protein
MVRCTAPDQTNSHEELPSYQMYALLEIPHEVYNQAIFHSIQHLASLQDLQNPIGNVNEFVYLNVFDNERTYSRRNFSN